MVNTKMMVGVVILASTLLVGCQKKPDYNARTNAQISQLAADVQVAKAEADRANQRLDNLTRHSTNYRK